MNMVYKKVQFSIGIVLIYLLSICCDTKPILDNKILFNISVVDSIGSINGSDAFAWVSSFCYLADGRIAIMDGLCKELLIFENPDNISNRISIEGHGPGEFFSSSKICPLSNNGICISGFRDNKLAFYDSLFNFEYENIITGGNLTTPIQIEEALNGKILGVSFYYSLPDYAGTAIAIWGTESIPDHIINFECTEFDQRGAFQTKTAMTACIRRDGMIFTALKNPECYEILVWNTNYENINSIILEEYEPQEKPMAVKEIETELARKNWILGTGSEEGFSFEPQNYFNSIEYLGIDSENRLWVLKGDYTMPKFDIYSSEGEYLGESNMSMPDWQNYDRWMFDISPEGFLASPYNPECLSLVYILEVEE